MSEMELLMEQFNANFADAVRRQEQMFQQATEQFQAMTKAAHEQYMGMVSEAAPQVERQEDPPAGAWIESPADGEPMLVLNKPAAALFLSIFDQIGELIEAQQGGK